MNRRDFLRSAALGVCLALGPFFRAPTLEVLKLTGVNRERLFYGEWVEPIDNDAGRRMLRREGESSIATYKGQTFTIPGDFTTVAAWEASLGP